MEIWNITEPWAKSCGEIIPLFSNFIRFKVTLVLPSPLYRGALLGQLWQLLASKFYMQK